jgi:uncharacterized protein (DUF488 family)
MQFGLVPLSPGEVEVNHSGARYNSRMRLYTVGHGSRSTSELISVLGARGVGRLVDVRRYPRSRRHPHLSYEALAVELPAAGIGVEWCGEELGGRRRPRPGSRHTAWRNDAFRGYADHMDTDLFQGAIDRLLAQVEAGPPTAVMCAETLWWRCHRRLIADAVVLAGGEVVHLLDERSAQPHQLHPAVRPDDAGRPVYDGGAEELPLNGGSEH